jgi:hypothetical protein
MRSECDNKESLVTLPQANQPRVKQFCSVEHAKSGGNTRGLLCFTSSNSHSRGKIVTTGNQDWWATRDQQPHTRSVYWEEQSSMYMLAHRSYTSCMPTKCNGSPHNNTLVSFLILQLQSDIAILASIYSTISNLISIIRISSASEYLSRFEQGSRVLQRWILDCWA